jgi:peptidoglycan/LPS O-acetylase OafA/YrhL
MVFLGQVATSRDNNLNLIRMIAAFAVLVSHAWPIALGPDAVQPLKALTGFTLGTLSVWVFFAISGYLITLSFVRTDDTSRFVLARMRRLMPGLVASVVVVAFVIGPIVTALPLIAYLTDPATGAFLWRNATMAMPQYSLPGVFVDQPYTDVIGSIWTLFYEVLCYAGVLIVGLLGLLQKRRAMALLIGAYGLVWIGLVASDVTLHPKLSALHQLSLPFVIGMAFYLWRNAVPLHGIAVLATFIPVVLLRDTVLYGPAFALAISYATFWLAYVPGGIIRAYNRMGDYSYGLYIYAFPLQGLAVWLVPGQGVWLNIAIATPLTVICAVVSWHYVERPAMQGRFRLFPTAAQRQPG